MKIEKLRKNHKREIIIGTILAVVIGGALTFKLTHSKYRTTQIIDLATGTINLPDYKIVAMYQSNNGTDYTEITTMPSSGYVINESKSYCNQNGSKDTSAVLKTVNGSHIIETKFKADKCYLYFDKVPTASEMILTNLGENIKDTAPDFNKTATTDEGVFKTEDGMYGSTDENKIYTYYWRGAVTNNYVKFAGFCWRIVRINGDKSIRLIYDGSTCHKNGTSTTDNLVGAKQKFNTNYDRSEYVGWTYEIGSQRTLSGIASNIKIQTDSWYSNYIGNNATYSAKVADGKFCNNRDVMSGYNWSSQPSSTFYYISKKEVPVLSCPLGDMYNMKAGTITADEVILAGSRFGSVNVEYYLYNGQYYWTMTPYSLLWNGKERGATVLYVGNTGHLRDSLATTDWGIRPVINLRSDVTFSSGDGTQNSPYTVS